MINKSDIYKIIIYKMRFPSKCLVEHRKPTIPSHFLMICKKEGGWGDLFFFYFRLNMVQGNHEGLGHWVKMPSSIGLPPLPKGLSKKRTTLIFNLLKGEEGFSACPRVKVPHIFINFIENLWNTILISIYKIIS